MEEQEQKQKARILRIPKYGQVTFVTVVFALIFIYFIVQGILLMSHHSIQVYNVGIPTDDNVAAVHTGIILREETVVQSQGEGHLSFFTISGEWVSKDQLVLSVDYNGNVEEKLKTLLYGHSTLSKSARLKIQSAIRSAVETYDGLNFETAIRSKGDIEATILNALIHESTDLESKLAGMSYTPYYADESGFLMNWTDGFEGKTTETLTSSDFKNDHYVRTVIRGGTKVYTGSTVYKLAPDNRFTLAFLLTDSEVAAYGNRKTLSVRMSDGIEITGDFTRSVTADGKPLGILTFAKYGGNYLTERFQEFRILDKSVTGYKIPESAITTKSFFVVPKEFITSGGGSNEQGVMAEVDGKLKFIPATVYVRDSSGDRYNFVIGENSAYVFSSELSAGMRIIAPGNERLETTLGVMAAVEGCFQVNSGYCIFKPIVRIQNSLDTSYVIISENVRGSLKSYDRIVLYAENLAENEIIFE
ncbi:MAG: hypothetical protein J5794_02375 [Lachnospiraceae bacterium]|nr:hypothetical protein [Lachnospiraceae bacterium]